MFSLYEGMYLFQVYSTFQNDEAVTKYEDFQRMFLPKTTAIGKWSASHYLENSDQKVISGEPNCISPTLETNDIFDG